MRTFVGAVLASAVAAQTNSTNTTVVQSAVNTAKDAWTSVKNWFASTTSTYLTTET